MEKIYVLVVRVLTCWSPCELDPSAEARWRRHLSCLVPSLGGGRNRPPLSPSSCPEQVDVPYLPPALPPFTSPALPSIPAAIQAPSASLLRGTGPAPAASPLGTLTACASSRPKEKPSGASFQGRVLRRSPGACSVPAPTRDRGPGPRRALALSPVLSLPCHARSLVKSAMKIDPQELFLAGSAGCCAQHVLGLFSLLRIFFFSPPFPLFFSSFPTFVVRAWAFVTEPCLEQLLQPAACQLPSHEAKGTTICGAPRPPRTAGSDARGRPGAPSTASASCCPLGRPLLPRKGSRW